MSRLEKILIIINISFIIVITLMSFYLVSRINNHTLEGDEKLLRYEMVFEGNKVIVFDKITGEYWTKFESTNEGPTNWEKSEDLKIKIDMIREFTTE